MYQNCWQLAHTHKLQWMTRNTELEHHFPHNDRIQKTLGCACTPHPLHWREMLFEVVSEQVTHVPNASTNLTTAAWDVHSEFLEAFSMEIASALVKVSTMMNVPTTEKISVQNKRFDCSLIFQPFRLFYTLKLWCDHSHSWQLVDSFSCLGMGLTYFMCSRSFLSSGKDRRPILLLYAAVISPVPCKYVKEHLHCPHQTSSSWTPCTYLSQFRKYSSCSQ